MSIPSQSQSSPVIHFTHVIRHNSSPTNQTNLSPTISIDCDSQQKFTPLKTRPQSTPKSSSLIRRRSSSDVYDSQQTDENQIQELNKRRKTINNCSSLTTVTPLNEINNQIDFNMINDDDKNNTENRFYLHPPPLMVLSQSIQAKHPEQLFETKLNNQFSTLKDLPHVPANYSFVFYGFNQIQIEDAKRLTRRMADCFTSETIDITTTHIILPFDNPHLTITLDLVLAFIYGCRIVTFEWLKLSTRIGEWLSVNKFEPKKFLNKNLPLNNIRKLRQQRKPIELFHHCDFIYVTSIVDQRQLLVKLITLLGGNITINRDRAKIIVGQSSKILDVIIYPQVHEKWVIDSIKSGKCLPTNDYLI